MINRRIKRMRIGTRLCHVLLFLLTLLCFFNVLDFYNVAILIYLCTFIYFVYCSTFLQYKRIIKQQIDAFISMVVGLTSRSHYRCRLPLQMSAVAVDVSKREVHSRSAM